MTSNEGPTGVSKEAVQVLDEAECLLKTAQDRAQQFVQMTREVRSLTAEAIGLHASIQATRAQLEALTRRLRKLPKTDPSARC